DQAPLVEVVDLQGRRVSLEPEGQVVIVDFFATWCPQCRESLRGYRDIVAAYGGRVHIVVVDVEEPAAVTRAFFAQHPLPGGVVLARDPHGSAMHAFGARGFPSFFVVDPRGTVRDVTSGWGPGSTVRLLATLGSILD